MAGPSRTALLAIVALSVSAAAAADDARALLVRMERALSSRNYQGVFVHEHDGHSETLKIIHRSESGGFTERIVSLDGSGREVIRRDGESRAYFPDQHAVLVESGQRGGLLFPGLASLGSAAGQIYAVSEESPTRISGREARVVVVEPRDELRYGYRVWIDEASAMPLKTQLRTAGGRVVEQLVFTELSLPAHIADAALQPAVVARQYRWMRREAVNRRCGRATRRCVLGRGRAAARLQADRQFHADRRRRAAHGHAPGVQRRAGLGLRVRGTAAAIIGCGAGGCDRDDDDPPGFLFRAVHRGRRAQGDRDRRGAARDRAGDHALAARRLRPGHRRDAGLAALEPWV